MTPPKGPRKIPSEYSPPAPDDKLPDAWQRFEGAVDKVMKGGPQHRMPHGKRRVETQEGHLMDYFNPKTNCIELPDDIILRFGPPRGVPIEPHPEADIQLHVHKTDMKQ
jgi:hypothetical protein